VAKNEEIKITALYERLSRDDEQVGESNSIQNQKMYLEEYARQQGLRNIRHFWDDGYSGTNFNRPGFQSLLAEIEAGHVATLIVKDLSRFGRNYLQVGYYTEILFPKKGIRFIAINNGVDSAKPSENDFTPFLNIMNEFYSRDTSNKIKAVFKARMKNGMRCSGSIPYGYKRTKEDKQQLIVDEPAAEVVREVFRLACRGIGVTAIADRLTAEKVLIPSAYAARYSPENCRHSEVADPYRWSATTVGYILDRQEYLGHTVLGKSICENFKTRQRRAATADELMIFPDTHEAIIDQDTWDIAHKLRLQKRPKAANGTYTHRLSGLVYCADCGARMSFCSPDRVKSGKQYDSSSAFQCGNYRSTTTQCVSHFVKTSVLEAAILRAIQAVSRYALENEAEFVADLKGVWEENQSKSTDSGQQELDEARKRMAELDAMIQNLYESSVKGVLPERQAQRMIQQYDEEQILLERRVQELESQIQQETVKKADTERFLALVKKYRDCAELTDTMLYSFIDRVEVHAATGGRTIYRQQHIDIHFNFIGSYYPPVETVSEEERIAAIDAAQKQKKQEKGRRAAARRKEKLDALRLAAEAGEPEAIAQYEQYLNSQRERNQKYRQKVREAREADPEYLRQLDEKERIRQEKLLESERKRMERATRKKKLSRAELKEKAKTDPEAAEQWAAMKAKEAEARQRKKEREETRMAADPEYAAMMAERKAEYTRTRTAKRKAEHDALVELAKTDPAAAQQLADKRKYQSEATVRSYQKMKADAEAGDPEAIRRYEAHLAKRREDYHKKKQSKEDVSA
jgi:site-specific DNA recombinase